MIQYRKTIKILKWIFQKHRNEPATRSSKDNGEGEMKTVASEKASNWIIYESGEMEDEHEEETDRRIVVGRNQQSYIAGLAGNLYGLKERMNTCGASFTINLNQLKDMGYVAECFTPSFRHCPLDNNTLLHQEREKANAMDNIRRCVTKIIGNKGLPNLKEKPRDENAEKKETHKSYIDKLRASRMGEIVKWQGTAKSTKVNRRWTILNRNKGSLKGTPSSEEYLLTCSSKMSKWNITNCSSSSSSSSSTSTSSSSFRVQSRMEMQVARSSVTRVAPNCSKDIWITSDSEYVVLEI
ncbi:uncharacterized protein LOC131057435 [Cryptomeria japonica]|uniref:uncharacterized protein LOC131057435 n=1 Tax=Cryptomeria japonica TaxID=3369 RepID=UPI0025ABC994|nr:uncharacterized protein LOC131057435 [Cryptomeria japonica]